MHFASTAVELWASSVMANGMALNNWNVQCILGKTFHVFKTAKRFPGGSNENMKENTMNNNAEKALVASIYELINFSLYCKNL